MARKRTSLFPVEASSVSSSLLLQPEQKSNLFGLQEAYEVNVNDTTITPGSSQIDTAYTPAEANLGSIPLLQQSPESPVHGHHSNRNTASSSPISVINSLGGNLHQLKSGQINRIINVKYSNDPILLIKQLSVDLAQKESELILLRQENFIREQQLVKLCNEYGNLSTLEIDQKLKEMNENHNSNGANHSNNDIEYANEQDRHVDEILKGLIGTAIHNEMDTTKRKEHETSPEKHRKKESNHVQAQASNESENPFYGQFPKPKSWLRNWFNSSEDLTLPPTTQTQNTTINNRPYSKSFNLSFMKNDNNTSSKPNISATKLPAPVELDSIKMGFSTSSNETDLDESEADTSREEVNIDKYGFFNDIENVLRAKSPPPPTTETRAASTATNSIDESQAILIGNRDILQTIDQLKEISKIHDSTNQQIEKQWDTLMKEISRDFYKYMNTDHDEGSEMFGIRGLNIIKLDSRMNGNFLNDTAIGKIRTTPAGPYSHHYSQLVKLIDKFGISSKYRYSLWLELSGAKNLMVNGVYQELLSEVKQYEDEDAIEAATDPSPEVRMRKAIIQSNIKQIKLDLHRTLPRNYYFNNLIDLKPGPNFYKLQRILYAFIAYRPDIGYLQGMNKIVGNLLLIASRDENKDNETAETFSEVDIFWIFIGLIEEILPKYRGPNNKPQVFFNSLLSIRTDQMVLNRVYLKKFLPDLHHHFAKLEVETELISLNWWLTLFIDLKFLKLETWFKLFDSLLVDDLNVGGSSNDSEANISEALNLSSSVHSVIDEDLSTRGSIKLICLTLAIFKGLQQVLLDIQDKEFIYDLLNSNGSNGYRSENISRHMGNKLSLRYDEITKYSISFAKKISGIDLKLHRREFIKSEGY
ncbi:rab-GTPase-TBC domain-containing protein [Scheffersomyces xylosifermentans]|uniref:rab-GTPase-TBC domain-containing protein n=1 Tax=Scheffersomyces xylosifermentans TaxID=1304137 RepID=UPI00315DB6E8